MMENSYANALKSVITASESYDKQVEICKFEEFRRKAMENCLLDSIKTIKNDYDVAIELIKVAYEYYISKSIGIKSSYEYVINMLKTDFFKGVDEVKLIKMCECGFDRYSYSFYFSAYEYEFNVEIPNYKNITLLNYVSANYGKISISYFNGKYHEVIGKSYDVKELCDVIPSMLKKLRGDNNA